MRRALALGVSLLLGAKAHAATATLTTAATTAKLGDPVAVRLTVDPGADGVVDASPLPDMWGPAQVLTGGWEPAAAGTGVRVWSGTVALYQLGAVTIPPVAVPILAGTRQEMVSTEPVALDVQGNVPAGEAAKSLADLKPPASIPPDWGPLKRALAAFALLLAAAGVAWWLWRRYASRFAAVPAAVDPFRKLPPHVWVYEELERLLARRLAEEGQIGTFYDELTRIVKQYLQGRYRVDLMDRTTSEVPGALKLAGAPVEATTLARALLESSDRVKFARATAGPEQCRGSVEDAYRLVDLTKPAIAPAAAEVA